MWIPSTFPSFSGGVENYALHIAEEDGQVDMDFQALNPREMVDRFGFSILALIPRLNANQESSKDVVVTL